MFGLQKKSGLLNKKNEEYSGRGYSSYAKSHTIQSLVRRRENNKTSIIRRDEGMGAAFSHVIQFSRPLTSLMSNDGNFAVNRRYNDSNSLKIERTFSLFAKSQVVLERATSSLLATKEAKEKIGGNFTGPAKKFLR